MPDTQNLRIKATHALSPPAVLEEELPLPESAAQLVLRTRAEAQRVLAGEDPRLLVIVGPCSVHDPVACLEYAERLATLRSRVDDALLVVMRVYFEKPRSTVGWKGLINDPDLDNSFRINKGLRLARRFLLDVLATGLPAATEFLDTTLGQYFADLITIGAIGARTAESQIHRELASGLSMPVGFKNRTDGDVAVARDAIVAAGHCHSFPTLTREGMPAILETTGNRDCFLILRGGSDGPNFSAEHVAAANRLLQGIEPPPGVVVDCSHGNSRKQHEQQGAVVDAVIAQLADTQAPRGVMLESHLQAGNQALAAPELLAYGQSITDACVGWETTMSLLERLAAGVRARNG
ncbi:MAG: 3-deoxy-7-phosphoheptulonate synthase [Pseudomonadota bacterium]